MHGLGEYLSQEKGCLVYILEITSFSFVESGVFLIASILSIH